MMNSNNGNGINLVLEEIKGIETINEQYKKELKDAQVGAGLCSGLPKNARESIVKTLIKHITDNEKSITEMLAYVREIENE